MTDEELANAMSLTRNQRKAANLRKRAARLREHIAPGSGDRRDPLLSTVRRWEAFADALESEP